MEARCPSTIRVPSLALSHLAKPDFAIFFLFCLFVCFQDRVSLCNSSGYPGTPSVEQGWPQTHRDPPVSAFQVLGIKACTTTAQPEFVFLRGTKRPPCHNVSTTLKLNEKLAYLTEFA